MANFNRAGQAPAADRQRLKPGAMDAEPILEVKGVSKDFNKHKKLAQVLAGVNLTIRKGEVVALVGPSGAGKTTLFHIVAGLLDADCGSAVCNGRPLPLIETHRGRENMSLVFQDPFTALSDHMRVRQSIREPLRIKGREAGWEQRVRQALEAVGLAPAEVYLDRYPGQLSGGQRQRVAIARAIASEPSLLLADEPTSMLDVSAGVGVLNLFRSLAAMGMAVLITIHDLASACYVADRLVILAGGRVVEEGEPSAILANPKAEITSRLVAAARALELKQPREGKAPPDCVIAPGLAPQA